MKTFKKTFFRILLAAMELLLLLYALLIVNIYALVGSSAFPDVVLFDGDGWELMPVILFALMLILVSIKVKGLGAKYVILWKQNLGLVIFLIVAVLSLTWSVYLDASLYKLVFLFFATAMGAYICVRFGLEGSIEILTWVAVLGVALSILTLLFLPSAIMYNPPYIGSWRGIFWHRNHAGNIWAYFNAIFLFRLLYSTGWSVKRRTFDFVFYILSLVLVFGSRSATGIIVFFALHLFLGLSFFWLRWHTCLKSWHYYLFIGISATFALIFFTNVGFFFGLLGRSATMTGRTPLWSDLIFNFWLQKPLLGYGYGALWMQKSFRYLMMERQGWTLFPVFFADNGFLDILLNLGLAGFVPFAVMFFTRWYQSFSYAIQSKRWVVFFLPLTFTYVFIGNAAYSFLLEVDQFVWTILIIAVFLTSSFARLPTKY